MQLLRASPCECSLAITVAMSAWPLGGCRTVCPDSKPLPSCASNRYCCGLCGLLPALHRRCETGFYYHLCLSGHSHAHVHTSDASRLGEGVLTLLVMLLIPVQSAMYNGSSRSPSGLRYHVKLGNPLCKLYSGQTSRFTRVLSAADTPPSLLLSLVTRQAFSSRPVHI